MTKSRGEEGAKATDREILRGGLIQMALKESTDKSPAEITKAMIAAHIPYIEEAGEKGVQVSEPGR